MAEQSSFFPEIPTFQAVRPPDFIPEPIGEPAAVMEPVPTQPAISEPTPEKPERITLLGRLGSEIKFKVTPKGLLVASFPLAVRDDEGQTHWENVLAFGDRAEKLRDTLTRGQTAEVIGYRKQRTYKTRDGRERTVQEFNSVVVKPH